MSMIGNLLRVTEEELAEILEDSSILEDRIYAEDSEDDTELLEIDKAWEGILYLLTGKSLEEVEEAQAPLVWTLFSGQIVDEEQEMGYGPAQYVTAEQVKQINQALSVITEEYAKSQYDSKIMMEKGIYPEIWEDNDALEYLLSYLVEMKIFYKQAAEENKAVITFLN